jgi:hypothetical protein
VRATQASTSSPIGGEGHARTSSPRGIHASSLITDHPSSFDEKAITNLLQNQLPGFCEAETIGNIEVAVPGLFEDHVSTIIQILEGA